MGHTWKHWICYYAIVLKNKERQKMITQKSFTKLHIVQQTKHRWQIISIDMFCFETQEIGCYHENKLQFDEKNNKNWKVLKDIWKCIWQNLRLKAMNWLLRVTPIIQSSVTSLRDLSAIYGYLKNKNRQKQNFQEKNEREKRRRH